MEAEGSFVPAGTYVINAYLACLHVRNTISATRLELSEHILFGRACARTLLHGQCKALFLRVSKPAKETDISGFPL